MAEFVLDARLAADCHVLGDWPLSRVLLMDDARWPWLILVPRRADVRELYELDAADAAALLRESRLLSAAMSAVFAPDKLNVAALGNVVPQLHLHHVARRAGDPGWPGPVWGMGARAPYTAQARAALLEGLRPALVTPPVPVCTRCA